MRFIGRISPATMPWRRWKTSADSRNQAMVTAWQLNNDTKATFTDYYRHETAKSELMAIFKGKCAYCEVLLTGSQPGDVEHYRPKGGLNDDVNRPVVNPATNKEHGGYFWLAYEWFNLLVSCNDCNKIRINKGEYAGKGERFPIADESTRGYAPGTETGETPLLLNPIDDDPEQHLQFDTNTGLVIGLTDKGIATIKLLGLNRAGLKEERFRLCNEVRGYYPQMAAAAIFGNDVALNLLREQLQRHKDMLAPYSAFAAVIIKEVEPRLRTVLAA